MADPAFEYWFSYPCELTPSGMIGPDEDLLSLRIELASGAMYEFTVWTDAYMARMREHDRKSGDRLSGQYLPLPDLVVANNDVTLIEQTIADLIRTQQLRSEWIIPDEYTASYDKPGPEHSDEDDPEDAWVPMPESVAREVGWSGCHGRPAA